MQVTVRQIQFATGSPAAYQIKAQSDALVIAPDMIMINGDCFTLDNRVMSFISIPYIDRVWQRTVLAMVHYVEMRPYKSR